VTVDEAVRDLLAVSTDIRQAVVVDAQGAVLGGAPGVEGAAVATAADGLWQAAVSAVAEGAEGGGAPLEHVVVDLGDAAVIVLAANGRQIVGLTAADPALGLALFDLRTCLADAFPDDDPAIDDDAGEPA
jgi:hypothetical protein